MKNFKEITGIVIAGGKSSRMGENKALLKINEKTIIEILISKLEVFFEKILIITNSPQDFIFTNKIIFTDEFPGLGPIAGIHSGLKNSNTEKNFIISCDLPFITEDAIEFLLNFNSKSDVLFYKDQSHIQPMCGIYNKKILKIAESLILSSTKEMDKTSKIKLRLSDLFNEVSVKEIEIHNLSFYSDQLFFNMNDKSDFQKVKDLLTGR